MESSTQDDDRDNQDSTDIGDIFGHEDSTEFVQQWNPQGQSGMSDAINHARAKAEQQQIKQDGLHGSDILGSTGMESSTQDDDRDNQDSTDIGDIFGHEDSTEFVQQWNPQGQSGMSDAIKHAKAKAEQQQIKQDGLQGNDILGSSGLESSTQDDDRDNQDSTDIGDIFGHEDSQSQGTEFVQQWNPQGQSGMSDAIKHAKAKAEQQQIKQDGLQGNDILGSSGLESSQNDDDRKNDDSTDIGDIFGHEDSQSQDTEFVQQWSPAQEQKSTLLQVAASLVTKPYPMVREVEPLPKVEGTAVAANAVEAVDYAKTHQTAVEAQQAYKVAEKALEKLAWDSNTFSAKRDQLDQVAPDEELFTEPPYERIKQAKEAMMLQQSTGSSKPMAETPPPADVLVQDDSVPDDVIASAVDEAMQKVLHAEPMA